MKVTQERNFDPVIITLENIEELDGLWHILHCDEYQTLKTYATNCSSGYGGRMEWETLIIKIKEDLQKKLYNIRERMSWTD